jgi:hypothetical protein
MLHFEVLLAANRTSFFSNYLLPPRPSGRGGQGVRTPPPPKGGAQA